MISLLLHGVVKGLSAYLKQNELRVPIGEVWGSEISKFYKNTGNNSVKQDFQLL